MKIKPIDNETWRFCGILNHHYDWTVSKWQDYFKDGETEDKFKECHCCKTPFKGNEFPYAGFFPEDEKGFSIRIVCKECAYKVSDKVTDYSLDENGDVKVTEWKRGDSGADTENSDDTEDL